MKSKSYLGFLMLLALMLFLVLLPSAFSSVYQNTGNGLIPEWTFGTKTQDRVETNQKKECFETDAKQPFKFDVCYVPNRPYHETLVEVVFPSGTPLINVMEIFDLTNKVGKIRKASLFNTNGQRLNGTEKSNGFSITFKFVDEFDLADIVSKSGELKFVLRANAINNTRSTVEAVFKLQ